MEPLGSRNETGLTTLLVGALTGQYEFSEADRQAVVEWMVDHAAEAEVRALLIKIVRTQIGDTSEFRVKVAEAIRERFRSDTHSSADRPRSLNVAVRGSGPACEQPGD
jgi:hypothetical protein